MTGTAHPFGVLHSGHGSRLEAVDEDVSRTRRDAGHPRLIAGPPKTIRSPMPPAGEPQPALDDAFVVDHHADVPVAPQPLSHVAHTLVRRAGWDGGVHHVPHTGSTPPLPLGGEPGGEPVRLAGDIVVNRGEPPRSETPR